MSLDRSLRCALENCRITGATLSGLSVHPRVVRTACHLEVVGLNGLGKVLVVVGIEASVVVEVVATVRSVVG